MASSVEQSESEQALSIGILTISDRASSGEREDLSGPAIRKVAEEHGFTVSVYACIPDDQEQIAETLMHWADDDVCNCILTTGGTGLSSRDVTPEATQMILDRQLPHLAAQIALTGAQTVPTALLSRALAGTRGATLIVNLPGSPNGAKDGAKIVFSIARHTIDVLIEQGDLSH